MPDLKDDLRTYVDRLADLAEAAATPLMSAADARRRSSRILLVVACAAVVTVVVGAVAVTRRDEPQESDYRGPPGRTAGVSVAGNIPDGWSQLPTTLRAYDLGSTPFATDFGIITIHPQNGGEDVAGEIRRSGDAEPRSLAPSGIEWRAGAAIVWTGTEVVVAGGGNATGITHAAAAYNPATDSWRALPDPPDGGVGPGVWTGTELVSWSAGVAFDPIADEWRRIAPSPLATRTDEAVAVVGGSVFVWGGCDFSEGNCDDVLGGDEFTDGAIYNPAADAWTMLPPSPLGAGDNATAVWTGDEVVVTIPVPVDPDAPTVAAFDPVTDSWRVLASSPHPGGMYTVAVWTGHLMVLNGDVDGATTALDPVSGQWYRLPNGPERSRHAAVALRDGSLMIDGDYPDSSPWLLKFTEASLHPIEP